LAGWLAGAHFPSDSRAIISTATSSAAAVGTAMHSDETTQLRYAKTSRHYRRTGTEPTLYERAGSSDLGDTRTKLL